MASGSGDAVPMEDRVKGDGKNDRPKEKERMTKESLRASPKRTRLAITAGRKGILLVTVGRSSSARSDCCS